MGDQGQTVKSSLWARSCFPINGYTVSWSYFADTETPSRWETLCCPQVCGPQTVGPESWWCWLPLSSPPAHQKNVHELITPYFYYKTCHSLPQVGTLGLEGISLLCPPLPGKAVKLSFSTSPKTLSLRFDLASVHREVELSPSESGVGQEWESSFGKKS